MEVHVNYLAVAAAAVVSYIIGAIWYGAIFSKVWMKLTGITDMKPAPMNMVLVLVSSFVMAYVLDHSLTFGNYYFEKTGGQKSGISSALMGAFFLWLGFVATV